MSAKIDVTLKQRMRSKEDFLYTQRKQKVALFIHTIPPIVLGDFGAVVT
jgi:hypothetical protein